MDTFSGNVFAQVPYILYMFDKISVLELGHFEVDPDRWVCTLDYGSGSFRQWLSKVFLLITSFRV